MIIAVLQARVSSTRLPGKVLKPILGVPMLARQIERIKRSKKINKLVVATSTESQDDAIETLCRQLQVDIFRGSLNNVLDRFYQAARQYQPDYIVRLTGDCPLIDPTIIDAVIGFCVENQFDYVSNCLEPTFPDGLDVEAMRFPILEEAWHEAKLPSQLEHVTPFIHQQPQRYKIGSWKNREDLSHLRWTVDEQEDLILVEKVYSALYLHKPDFTMSDILELFELQPGLYAINDQYQRNAGMIKSLLADKEFLLQK